MQKDDQDVKKKLKIVLPFSANEGKDREASDSFSLHESSMHSLSLPSGREPKNLQAYSVHLIPKEASLSTTLYTVVCITLISPLLFA